MDKNKKSTATVDLVKTSRNTSDSGSTVRIAEAVAVGDYETIFLEMAAVASSPKDMSVFWLELLKFYRDMLVTKTTGDAAKFLELSDPEATARVATLFSKETLAYHCKLITSAYELIEKTDSAKRLFAEITLVRMCDEKSAPANEALDSKAKKPLTKVSSKIKIAAISLIDYWKSAAREFKSIKQLTAASLLVAIGIVIGMFDIRIIPNILQVSFSYIAFAICSFITGPLMAIPCGIIADLVDALWHGYDLFFGYTLSAVVQSVIFALFLYKRDITLPRIVAAKACVNLFVNILLGSVWRVAMMGGEYFYYVFVAGLKNIIMLPFEVVILVIFLRALLPALRRMKMVPRSTRMEIDRLDVILTCVLFALVVFAAALYFGNYTAINDFIKNLI